jgi:hypothetical protein
MNKLRERVRARRATFASSTLLKTPKNKSGCKYVKVSTTEKVRFIDFSQSTKDLDKLSEEIYKELLFAKEVCDKK